MMAVITEGYICPECYAYEEERMSGSGDGYSE
jgi:hypothetical protein